MTLACKELKRNLDVSTHYPLAYQGTGLQPVDQFTLATAATFIDILHSGYDKCERVYSIVRAQDI